MPWGHFPASVSVPSKFRLKYLDWVCQVYRTSNVPSPSWSPRPPPSASRGAGAAAVGSHGLCPAGFTQPVPKGLKVQGSGSPISLMTPHPVGGRMRVSAFPAGSARRSRGSLPGDSCGALWAVPGREPELPRIPLPVPPLTKCPGGRKGQILYVCSGKRRVCQQVLLAVEVQPGTGLPSLGSAEREQSSVAWPEWTLGARLLFAFDCFGLFVLWESRCCSRGAFKPRAGR